MSIGRTPVAMLGGFALVWASWLGTGLAGLWVYPLGLGEFSASITAVATAFALAVCAMVGARAGSFAVVVVAALGAIAGVACAWGLSIAIETRTAGDGIELAWLLGGCLAASAAALGVIVRRLVGTVPVTR